MNCCCRPATTAGVGGVMVMVCSVSFVGVTDAVAILVTPPTVNDAVMVTAPPALTAVAMPFEPVALDTDTDGSPLDHVERRVHLDVELST